MIEFVDVTRVFATRPLSPRAAAVTALDGLSLRLEAGGVRAIVGPNGAGKTTLFAILLGFLFPTSGHVRVGGLAPRAYLSRSGAAYLPERFRMPPEWTVRGALAGLARLEGLDGSRARERSAEAIDRFGLADHADKRIAALSRGLLQRVGMAQALLGERELVVFDEPTEGLDPIWRVRFRDIVSELKAEGRLVLIASHDLGEVERLADTVVLLNAGRVRDVFEARRQEDAAARYLIELEEPLSAVAEAFPGAVPVDQPGAAPVDQPGAAPVDQPGAAPVDQPGAAPADQRGAAPADRAGAAPADRAGVAPVHQRGASYRVRVRDPTELSERLAALLAAGGRIVAVRPADEPLEERVRRVLGGETEADR